jgi:hypothetical protein
MKTMTRNLGVLATATVLACGAAACSKAEKNTPAPTPEKPAVTAPAAPAPATTAAPAADAYPVDTCVVTGEKLGGMGDVVKFDYKGREIRFCCQGCIAKFLAEPDKYLKILDDATAAKNAK